MSRFAGILTIVLYIVYGGVAYVYAISDTFEINLTVISNDVDPPSIPANVVATGVSTSQIDVTWDPSTDNTSVTGYHLYRDDLLIATTTGTVYNDTGLATSTSYGYTVSAFDYAGNESATSSIAVGQTLAPPPVPPVATSTDTSANGPILEEHTPEFQEFQISPTQTDARLSWNTSLNAQTQIKWGKTNDYELGSLSNPLFQSSHSAFIGSLDPNTRYYLEVTVIDGVFNKKNVVRTTFTTTGEPDTNPPANVRGLTAVYSQKNSTLNLSWINPTDSDFEAVRVLRSTYFYPVSLYDGEVVYDGNGTTYSDTKIEKGATYYYTVFARDRNKNYSSGAVVQYTVRLTSGSGSEVIEVSTSTLPNPIHGFPEVEIRDPAFEFLSVSDFKFIQNGVQRSVSGSVVSVDSQSQLTISLPYDKVPEVLKTIGVTFVHPKDRRNTFTFLLRVDKEKENYTATIDALQENGNYGLYITMLDFEERRLTTLEGSVFAEGRTHEAPGITKTLVRLLILFLIVLLILLVIARVLTKKQATQY